MDEYSTAAATWTRPGQKVWRWFDHEGRVVSAPATAGRPTAYGTYDRLNHWMFGTPSEVPTFQALTLCGKRALEVPGRGEVDCPECNEEITHVGGLNVPDLLEEDEGRG